MRVLHRLANLPERGQPLRNREPPLVAVLQQGNGSDGPGVLRLATLATAVITGSAHVGGSTPAGEELVEIGVDCRMSVDVDLAVGGASPGTIKLLTDSSILNVSGKAVINSGGRVEGTGTFRGARLVNTGGLVSPGLSPGTLTVDGDYEQGAGAVLVIEVVGLAAGQFDVLDVTGSAALDGTLEVHFLDGFLPKTGDSFDFLQAGANISGQLARLLFPELADGFQADLTPTADGKLRLTARTDAVAGSGTSITPPGSLAIQSAQASPPAGCGAGACGAGGASALGFALLGLSFMKQSRHAWRARASRALAGRPPRGTSFSMPAMPCGSGDPSK